jgi:hypothetical protein
VTFSSSGLSAVTVAASITSCFGSPPHVTCVWSVTVPITTVGAVTASVRATDTSSNVEPLPGPSIQLIVI